MYLIASKCACGSISMNFLTHTVHTHTHNCMCTQHCFSAYVNWLQPTACCTALASHTPWPTFQLPIHSQLCLIVYTTAVCGWCSVLAKWVG